MCRTTSHLPTGTNTFHFTDLEDSTQLWEGHPAAMQTALARHDALLRHAVETNRGRIVKTTGDGCLAAFATMQNGLAAALAAQLALAAQAWSEIKPDTVRVRMALHSGVAELRNSDYFGTAVNRAARLMSVANGGQVLLSAVSAGLAAEQLPASTSLRDLGEHRLRISPSPSTFSSLSSPVCRNTSRRCSLWVRSETISQCSSPPSLAVNGRWLRSSNCWSARACLLSQARAAGRPGYCPSGGRRRSGAGA